MFIEDPKNYFLATDFGNDEDTYRSWKSVVLMDKDAPFIRGKQEDPIILETIIREKKYFDAEKEEDGLFENKKNNFKKYGLSYYQKLKNVDMKPVCIQSKRYEWLGASVDGISEDKSVVLKITDKSMVIEQLQHILAVTGHDYIHLLEIKEKSKSLTKVRRNEGIIDDLIWKSEMYHSILMKPCDFSVSSFFNLT